MKKSNKRSKDGSSISQASIRPFLSTCDLNCINITDYTPKGQYCAGWIARRAVWLTVVEIAGEQRKGLDYEIVLHKISHHG